MLIFSLLNEDLESDLNLNRTPHPPERPEQQASRKENVMVKTAWFGLPHVGNCHTAPKRTPAPGSTTWEHSDMKLPTLVTVSECKACHITWQSITSSNLKSSDNKYNRAGKVQCIFYLQCSCPSAVFQSLQSNALFGQDQG